MTKLRFALILCAASLAIAALVTLNRQPQSAPFDFGSSTDGYDNYGYGDTPKYDDGTYGSGVAIDCDK